MIEIKDLHKSFGDLEVLKGITETIKDGEIVSIIGPSGSGKSTFLRCINLLEEPTSGHIIIDGTEITDPKTDINKVRENLGMVFQRFNLFPHKTVLENITLAPINVKGIAQEEADKTARELLKRVGLLDKADVYPASLSGGQQQRVAIARALAAKPAIILADEPTGNLDSKTSQDVLGLIKVTSQRYAQTTVMITHNEEIAQMADRIVRIEDGHIVGNASFSASSTSRSRVSNAGVRG